MHASAPPLTEFDGPATFQGRGVVVPFTMSLLAGARVRASKRTGIELVVSSPSGARGAYVMDWSGVRALGSPTVHDTMLYGRLSLLPRIDPASVRDAALAVAREGYAGPGAMAAAETAGNRDRSERLLAHFLLMTELMDQLEPGGRKARVPAEQMPDFAQRATIALHRIARSLHCPAARLAGGLAAIGNAFAPVGIARDDQAARIPRLIARLNETQISLSNWLIEDPHNDVSGLGRAMTATMTAAYDGSETMLTTTRTALADPMAILQRWIANANDTLDRAARCDWLLDGWDCVCLLWMTANSAASRRAALLEMSQLLPMLPREAFDWTEGPIPLAAMSRAYRVTSQNDAWRSGGAAFALIHRNETMRAMSL